MVYVEFTNPLTNKSYFCSYYFTHTARSILLAAGFLPLHNSQNEFQHLLTGETALIMIRR